MAIFLILIGRLFYLQIIEGSQLQQKAVDQWTQTLPVTATRGRILDRDSQVLAQSGTTYMVTISPKSIKTANKVSVAEVLSEVLGLDRDKVLEKLNDESKASITLARQNI
jgi:stage V sporulation protein D (sporulation-specific penicillin-binding protein)